MNILFLTQSTGIAGSQHSIIYLCKGLTNKGHRVFLGCRRGSYIWDELSESAIKLYHIPFLKKIHWESMRIIRDIVYEHHIDIINAQSSKDRYAAIFARWRYGLNVKVIHTRRQKPESFGGFLKNLLYKVGTDKMIVISDELKKIFIRKGFPSNHLHVIYNGIPLSRFENRNEEIVEKLRIKYQISENDIVIGSVSRLKNQEQIIRALKLQPPNYVLLFVGIKNGVFDQLIADLNIKNRIIYAGMVEGDEVLYHYQLMKVNILASTMDGFGLALIEAMGMGIPVIGTNYGGIKNVIKDGWNGLLFEDNHIDQLSEKIELIVKNHSLREKLVKNAKKDLSERFSIERTVSEYENFFLGIINQK